MNVNMHDASEVLLHAYLNWKGLDTGGKASPATRTARTAYGGVASGVAACIGLNPERITMEITELVQEHRPPPRHHPGWDAYCSALAVRLQSVAARRAEARSR